MAGIRFGYALLWALLFATIGTIVLQEMAARLGVVGGIGLGAAIRRRVGAPWMRVGAALLVASAIVVGNAAYETGNLLGAALGIEVIGGSSVRVWALVTAVLALGLLWTGRYRVIERALVGAVVAMSLAFLVTAGWVARDPIAIITALMSPQIPEGGAIVALGLVGTTIVPYNLFLHADAARERFGTPATLDPEAAATNSALRDARIDLVVAIGLGGLVSMAVVVAAAVGVASGGGEAPTSAVELARGLTPLLGPWATVVFAIGLFAAGLTSAITAPLAAAYAMAGAMGWPPDLRDSRLRATLTLVIATGATFAVAGVRPLPAILFAQAANGLLLPLVALFLLLVMNDRQLLGRNTNGWLANALGALVVLLTAVLGTRALLSVFGS